MTLLCVPLNRDMFVRPRFYWIVNGNIIVKKKRTGDDGLLLLARETFFSSVLLKIINQ